MCVNKSVDRKSDARTSDNSTRVSEGILRAFVAGLRLLFYLFSNATFAVRVICCRIVKVFFFLGGAFGTPSFICLLFYFEERLGYSV